MAECSRGALSFIFNWRRYPAGVFLLAVPLFLLGFGCLAVQAVMQWYVHDKPGYVVIVLVGMIGLCAALIPAYRMHQALARMDAQATLNVAEPPNKIS